MLELFPFVAAPHTEATPSGRSCLCCLIFLTVEKLLPCVVSFSFVFRSERRALPSHTLFLSVAASEIQKGRSCSIARPKHTLTHTQADTHTRSLVNRLALNHHHLRHHRSSFHLSLHLLLSLIVIGIVPYALGSRTSSRFLSPTTFVLLRAALSRYATGRKL